MHEASLHERNSFVTLTLSDENVPAGGSLDKSLFPAFIKRVRKARAGRKIRYFHCGEYGARRHRPHYHAILFGEDFAEDRVSIQVDGGLPCWRSRFLESKWPLGHSSIGPVTPDSCAYVARYVVKKLRALPEDSTPYAVGLALKESYETVVPGTGEVVSRVPEFVTMSRGGRGVGGGGIGRGWFERYGADVFPSDEVIVGGRSCRAPRFYDKLLEDANPEAFAAIQRERDAERSFRSSVELSMSEVRAKTRLSLKPGRVLE